MSEHVSMKWKPVHRKNMRQNKEREHVSMKWKPVHRKNMRQNKEREHGFDSIKT
jgi:hypothetical protein